MPDSDEEDDVSAIPRFLSVAAMMAGVLVVYAYPWAVKNLSGREVGIYRIYDGGKFPAAAAILADTDAPVRVDVVVVAQTSQKLAPLALSVSASTRGKVVFSETLKLRHVTTIEHDPTVLDPVFRRIAGLIHEVEPGIYDFAIDHPTTSVAGVRSVDIVLRGGVMELDRRAHTFGSFVLATGMAGFAVSMARNHGRTKKVKVPAPRWGRNTDKT